MKPSCVVNNAARHTTSRSLNCSLAVCSECSLKLEILSQMAIYFRGWNFQIKYLNGKKRLRQQALLEIKTRQTSDKSRIGTDQRSSGILTNKVTHMRKVARLRWRHRPNLWRRIWVCVAHCQLNFSSSSIKIVWTQLCLLFITAMIW